MREIIWYIKNYREIPTTRILLDKTQDNPELQNNFRDILEMIDRTEIDPVEFCYDLDKIKNKHTKGEMHQLRNILEEDKDLKYQLREAERILGRVKEVNSGKKKTYTQKTIRLYASEFLVNYEQKLKDPEFGRGIRTGYSFLDFVTNGVMPAEMLLIGGSTSSGKSLFLNNMAIQMHMQNNHIYELENFTKGYNVLYFSLEMPYEACFRRTICRMANIPAYALRDAKLTHDEFRRLKQALEFIEKYPYEFEIVDISRGCTVQHIEDRFDEATKTYHPHITVSDYIGLMRSTSNQNDNDWLELGKTSGELYEFGKANDTCNLSAVQLNRPPQKSQKEQQQVGDDIGIHRIGRSGMILQNANIAIQIETRKDERTFPDFRYHIIKNRDGELGMHAIRKKFSHSSILDSDPPYQPKITEGECAGANDDEDVSAQLMQFIQEN
jgi:replicative DNA helicase